MDPSMIESFTTETLPSMFLLQIVIGTLYGTWLEGGERSATYGKRYYRLKGHRFRGRENILRRRFWAQSRYQCRLWYRERQLLVVFASPDSPHLTPLVTPKRQTVYDIALKCVVVKTA